MTIRIVICKITFNLFKIIVDYFLTDRSYYKVSGNRLFLDVTYNYSSYLKASVDGSISTDGYSTWGYVNKEKYIFADGSSLTYEGSYSISRIYTSNTSYGFRKNHDYLTGGNDYFYGTNKNDVLDSGSGDDVIFGNRGNDTLYASSGNDVLYGNKGNDILYGENGNDGIQGNEGNDKIYGGNGSDSITPGKGNDEVDGELGYDEILLSGRRSHYVITGDPDNLVIKDIRDGNPDGTDIIRNCEILRFSDQNFLTSSLINSAPSGLYFESNKYSSWDKTNSFISIQESLRSGTTLGLLSTNDIDVNDKHQYHLISTDNEYPDDEYFSIDGNKLKIKSSPNYKLKSSYKITLYVEDSAGNKTEDNYYMHFKVNDLIEKKYNRKFHEYKFYKLGNGQYQIKGNSLTDSITGETALNFQDQTVNVDQDIIGTFDQVTGLNTDSGKMFRLYNAAFARFPDCDGLKYWIGEFSSGRNSERIVAQSFLASDEFRERYGENVSSATYVNTLYQNVLGRDADPSGMNYWLGRLNSGLETRYEVLLGFAESAENKLLFTKMTGF